MTFCLFHVSETLWSQACSGPTRAPKEIQKHDKVTKSHVFEWIGRGIALPCEAGERYTSARFRAGQSSVWLSRFSDKSQPETGCVLRGAV